MNALLAALTVASFHSAPALAGGDWPAAPQRATPVLAASCSDYGAQLSSAKDPRLVRKGDMLSAVMMWGCGCPTGDVFTLGYEPSPDGVSVRLCSDPTRDLCEMACKRDFQWDMSAILKKAGTTKITFPDV